MTRVLAEGQERTKNLKDRQVPIFRGVIPVWRPRVVSVQDEVLVTVDSIVLSSFLLNNLRGALMAARLLAQASAWAQHGQGLAAVCISGLSTCSLGEAAVSGGP